MSKLFNDLIAGFKEIAKDLGLGEEVQVEIDKITEKQNNNVSSPNNSPKALKTNDR